ncbi:conjugal transfer protein TrbJ [Acidithiobacillus caldus]|uniref:conjugal transfer protein TrbJ n=1 Tax=Acidithiobacillus caldus TaxID=33059 RepID=UPI001C077009|nr:conjugal transfer protein TrbJ [Acidithiobacillus caldus]MBU2801351.1 conjugal transfer protein TrbJ [Acidithiobacillus caldus]
MSTRVRRIVAVLLGTMLVVPACADAGGGMTGGATLPEQIVQEATLIQSKISGAERLVEQIQQYENMVQNMVTLPQTLMNQVLQPVDQLYGLVSQAQALTTNAINISQQFQNLNAGFNPQITAEYSSQYESISQGLNNALNTLIQTAGLNPNDFANQAQAQQAIANAMANPNSRNALLQGAVAVGQQTTASLTQLYNLTRAEAQTEADWRKAQLAQTTQQEEMNQTGNQMLFGSNPLNERITTRGGTLDSTKNSLLSNVD